MPERTAAVKTENDNNLHRTEIRLKELKQDILFRKTHFVCCHYVAKDILNKFSKTAISIKPRLLNNKVFLDDY